MQQRHKAPRRPGLGRGVPTRHSADKWARSSLYLWTLARIRPQNLQLVIMDGFIRGGVLLTKATWQLLPLLIRVSAEECPTRTDPNPVLIAQL